MRLESTICKESRYLEFVAENPVMANWRFCQPDFMAIWLICQPAQTCGLTYFRHNRREIFQVMLMDWFCARSAGRRGRMDLVPLFVPTDVPLRDSPGPQKALKPLV